PGTPELIGANAEAIATAEDRERFKAAMQEIGLAVPPSATANSMDEAVAIVERIGLPVVVRPAYILGGKGTGIATTRAEFEPTAASVTVHPATRLTDAGYRPMRDAAFACIRRVGVETGGSNVQFALDPATGEMVIIEMNPRVSRSSALASKATGFPIAKIAAKL